MKENMNIRTAKFFGPGILATRLYSGSFVAFLSGAIAVVLVVPIAWFVSISGGDSYALMQGNPVWFSANDPAKNKGLQMMFCVWRKCLEMELFALDH
jgi:hypothetical protein